MILMADLCGRFRLLCLFAKEISHRVRRYRLAQQSTGGVLAVEHEKGLSSTLRVAKRISGVSPTR